MQPQEERWYTPEQLYEKIKIPEGAQAKMRMKTCKNRIPYIKIGGYVRYDRVDIDKWLEKHKIVGA